MPDAPPRVIVHVRSDLGDIPYRAAAQNELAGIAAESWRRLAGAFPAVDLSLDPVLRTQDADQVRTLMGRAAEFGGEAPPDLLRLLSVDVPGGVDPESLVAAVRALPFVELAYLESPISQPVTPIDDPLAFLQTHLLPAPFGMGALQAWALPGADGQGVRFTDIEYGWNLTHEDLAGAGVQQLTASVPSTDALEHSTACLGIVLAQDNDRGVIGLAPRCTAAIASALTPSLPDALAASIRFLQAGDVLLVEVQAAANRPVEIDPHVAMLIRALVLAGVVVIEPAGNGATDLDAIVRADGTGFQQGAFNFFDSGAVMVGARQAAVRARASFSNFGSRVDTHAFGEGVVTTSAAPGQPYRGIFGAVLPGMNGTSGASALVAGAAVVLQGIARARGTTITPDRMRRLLSDPSVNTPTDNPSFDRIGPMPNLDAAAQRI